MVQETDFDIINFLRLCKPECKPVFDFLTNTDLQIWNFGLQGPTDKCGWLFRFLSPQGHRRYTRDTTRSPQHSAIAQIAFSKSVNRNSPLHWPFVSSIEFRFTRSHRQVRVIISVSVTSGPPQVHQRHNHKSTALRNSIVCILPKIRIPVYIPVYTASES